MQSKVTVSESDSEILEELARNVFGKFGVQLGTVSIALYTPKIPSNVNGQYFVQPSNDGKLNVIFEVPDFSKYMTDKNLSVPEGFFVDLAARKVDSSVNGLAKRLTSFEDSRIVELAKMHGYDDSLTAYRNAFKLDPSVYMAALNMTNMTS